VAHEAVAHHAEGAGPGVVADAERGAEARVEALQHAHPLAAALDEPRAGVELVVKQVAHRPVGVIDENVRGAGSERAAHRRVDVLGHHDPAPLVIPAGRLDVLGIHQAEHGRREGSLVKSAAAWRTSSGFCGPDFAFRASRPAFDLSWATI
jgi:hypothetical protein